LRRDSASARLDGHRAAEHPRVVDVERAAAVKHSVAMSATFLEVTYRHGRPFAAFLRLPRGPGARVDHTREVRPGMVVDFSEDDTPLGLEIVDPATADEDTLLGVLTEIRASGVSRGDLAPLWGNRAGRECRLNRIVRPAEAGPE
jgi:hypothetical protein